MGRGRERDAVQTIGALRRAGRLLRRGAVDTIVLLLPAATAAPTVWLAAAGALPRLTADYDAPELARFDLTDEGLATALSGAPDGHRQRVPVDRSQAAALAALYLLNGDATIPIVLAGVPTSLKAAVAAGADLAEAIARPGRRAALVAVGELFSPLRRDSPNRSPAGADAFDQGLLKPFAARDRRVLLGVSDSVRVKLSGSLLPPLAALVVATPAELTEQKPSHEDWFGVGFLVPPVCAARNRRPSERMR